MTEIDIIRRRVETWNKVLKEIPEVVYIGDSILRAPTVPVEFEEGLEIGKKLGDILVKYHDIAGYGRGFAANQIGLNKSVYSTFVGDEIQIFINPKIIRSSDNINFYRELCLSSGITYADVGRPDWIEMKWTDEQNKPQVKKFDGFFARLHGHENGHLEGVINLDICGAGNFGIATFDPLKEQLRTSR